MRLLRPLLLTLLTFQTSGRAAALLVNGDFEGTTVNAILNDSGFAPIFVNLPTGWEADTNFRVPNMGWTGEVRNLNSPPLADYPLPYDRDPSDHFLIMSSPGTHRELTAADTAWSTISIYQDFVTVPGESYVVAFDMAGSVNTSDTNPNASIQISIEDSLNPASMQNLVMETDTWSQVSQGTEFQRYEHIFVATSTRSRLTLTDLTTWNPSTPRAALIDNVAVDMIPTIPEPSTSIALLGLLWISSRRQRPQA